MWLVIFLITSSIFYVSDGLPQEISSGPSDTGITCNETLAYQLFIKDTGLYWCQGSGIGLPLACLAPDSSRVDYGSSYWTDSAILVCTLNDDGVLSWKHDACLVFGQRVNVSATIQFELFLFQCIRSADGSLKLNVTGCQWENQSLPLWSKIIYEDNTYTCDPYDALQLLQININESGVAAGTPPPEVPGFTESTWKNGVGCVYNGMKWAVGEDKIELGNVWYKCTEDSPNPVIYGCYVNGTKYKTGETFYNTNNLLAFRCQKHESDSPFPVATPYACLNQLLNGTLVEYAPGRVWLSDNGKVNDQYVMTCIKTGITISRRSIGCYYKTNEGEGVLDDSCMKSVGPVTIQCWPLLPGVTANNRIKITKNPPTDADKARFLKGGLKYCDAKPLSSVINRR